MKCLIEMPTKKSGHAPLPSTFGSWSLYLAISLTAAFLLLITACDTMVTDEEEDTSADGNGKGEGEMDPFDPASCSGPSKFTLAPIEKSYKLLLRSRSCTKGGQCDKEWKDISSSYPSSVMNGTAEIFVEECHTEHYMTCDTDLKCSDNMREDCNTIRDGTPGDEVRIRLTNSLQNECTKLWIIPWGGTSTSECDLNGRNFSFKGCQPFTYQESCDIYNIQLAGQDLTFSNMVVTNSCMRLFASKTSSPDGKGKYTESQAVVLLTY